MSSPSAPSSGSHGSTPAPDLGAAALPGPGDRLPYLPALDKLRGLAVLLVLFTHTPHHLKGEVGLVLQKWLVPGYLGVDIFFALSGFLITRILLYEKDRGGSIPAFWMRRAVRIFPAFYLLVVVMAVVAPGPELPWVATYLSNIHFLGPNSSPLGHTWSLAVEEHFYLVWPLLVLGLSRRGARRAVLYGMLPLALATALVVVRVWPDEQLGLLGHLTPARILTLSLGSLLAFHERGLWRRPVTTSLLAVGVGTLGYVWGAAGFLVPALRGAVGLHQLFGLALVSTAVTVLFLQGGRLPWPRATALVGGPLAWVGRISYGLYLYHLPIFFACGLHGSAEPATHGRAALALGLTLVTAVTSFHLFERPLLAWGSRFRVGERRGAADGPVDAG